MQMECLNLDECDFLETSFKEYKTENEYLDDGEFNKTKDGKKKGVILCFNDGLKPVYKYTPLNITTYAQYEIWRDETIDANSHLTWITDTYWYMETLSCVLVRRNKLWFNAIKHKFREVWDIILKERKDGYEHRKPKKRTKKKGPKLAISTPPLNAQMSPSTANFKIDTQTLKSFVLEI